MSSVAANEDDTGLDSATTPDSLKRGGTMPLVTAPAHGVQWSAQRTDVATLHTADSTRQTAHGRQHTAERRQQAADSRQQVRSCYHRNNAPSTPEFAHSGKLLLQKVAAGAPTDPSNDPSNDPSTGP